MEKEERQDGLIARQMWGVGVGGLADIYLGENIHISA